MTFSAQSLLSCGPSMFSCHFSNSVTTRCAGVGSQLTGYDVGVVTWRLFSVPIDALGGPGVGCNSAPTSLHWPVPHRSWSDMGCPLGRRSPRSLPRLSREGVDLMVAERLEERDCQHFFSQGWIQDFIKRGGGGEGSQKILRDSYLVWPFSS